MKPLFSCKILDASPFTTKIVGGVEITQDRVAQIRFNHKDEDVVIALLRARGIVVEGASEDDFDIEVTHREY